MQNFGEITEKMGSKEIAQAIINCDLAFAQELAKELTNQLRSSNKKDSNKTEENPEKEKETDPNGETKMEPEKKVSQRVPDSEHSESPVLDSLNKKNSQGF